MDPITQSNMFYVSYFYMQKHIDVISQHPNAVYVLLWAPAVDGKHVNVKRPVSLVRECVCVRFACFVLVF